MAKVSGEREREALLAYTKRAIRFEGQRHGKNTRDPWRDRKSGIRFAALPSISTAIDFVKEDIECWCYYCCGPRGAYLNRLMDTPLAKIGMHGILFYRWPFKGFLHWGFNYWFQSSTRNLLDVYTEQDGLTWPSWAYGDPFQVYPGPDGKRKIPSFCTA